MVIILPEANTSLGKAQLSNIQDGDIIAIVTTKKGIDYSHLGFCCMGKGWQVTFAECFLYP